MYPEFTPMKSSKTTQMLTKNILLVIDKTVIKISSITAIHYQNGKTMIHLNGGKFIEIPQTEYKHVVLVEEYRTKLQATLPKIYKK